MGFYERHVLPRVIDFACGMEPIMEQRRKVVPLATGRVLEIGVGSGHNLPVYDPDKVEMVWALEPSEAMRARAAHNEQASRVEVHWLDLPGERIPLADASVDTVVVTYTLCTIPDWLAALRQMHRVLRPEGRLLFCEHGAAPDADVRRWQDRLNRIWPLLCGGCNLNRDVTAMLEAGGFAIESCDAGYMDGGPRFAAFNCLGTARPR